MFDNSLIGLWSADVQYGPGAQSDDVFIFKPDGTGRYEFQNWMLCSADLFRWEVRETGVLRIVGEKCLQISEDARHVEQEPSRLGTLDLEYRIAIEMTPSGKRMPVLRLPLDLPMPNCFGFVRSDVTGLDEPVFTLES